MLVILFSVFVVYKTKLFFFVCLFCINSIKNRYRYIKDPCATYIKFRQEIIYKVAPWLIPTREQFLWDACIPN